MTDVRTCKTTLKDQNVRKNKKRKLEELDEKLVSGDARLSPKKQKLSAETDDDSNLKRLKHVYLVWYQWRVYYGDIRWSHEKYLIGTFVELEDANKCARDYWNERCLEKAPDESEDEELMERHKQNSRGIVKAVLPKKGKMFDRSRYLLETEPSFNYSLEMHDHDGNSGMYVQSYEVYVKKQKLQ